MSEQTLFTETIHYKKHTDKDGDQWWRKEPSDGYGQNWVSVDHQGEPFVREKYFAKDYTDGTRIRVTTKVSLYAGREKKGIKCTTEMEKKPRTATR